MMTGLRYAVGILALCGLMGCATSRDPAFTFLGISEAESSDRGPVGLINGTPCQIKNVTAVSETSYQQYQATKQAGRICVEQTQGDYVYYAVKEQRDVRFDNASALVEVIERFKARKP